MDYQKYIESYLEEHGAEADFDRMVNNITEAEANEPREAKNEELKAIYNKVSNRMRMDIRTRQITKEAIQEKVKRNIDEAMNGNKFTIRG